MCHTRNKLIYMIEASKRNYLITLFSEPPSLYLRILCLKIITSHPGNAATLFSAIEALCAAQISRGMAE